MVKGTEFERAYSAEELDEAHEVEFQVREGRWHLLVHVGHAWGASEVLLVGLRPKDSDQIFVWDRAWAFEALTHAEVLGYF